MAFDIQQFKEYLALELEHLSERDKENEDKIHAVAAKLVETDKAAVELRTLYNSDHVPKQELERRITRLETKLAVYAAIGGLLGGGIVAAVSKTLGF